jgi:hypothetical protein
MKKKLFYSIDTCQSPQLCSIASVRAVNVGSINVGCQAVHRVSVAAQLFTKDK